MAAVGPSDMVFTTSSSSVTRTGPRPRSGSFSVSRLPKYYYQDWTKAAAPLFMVSLASLLHALALSTPAWLTIDESTFGLFDACLEVDNDVYTVCGDIVNGNPVKAWRAVQAMCIIAMFFTSAAWVSAIEIFIQKELVGAVVGFSSLSVLFTMIGVTLSLTVVSSSPGYSLFLSVASCILHVLYSCCFFCYWEND